jgi:hypothetical protein
MFVLLEFHRLYLLFHGDDQDDIVQHRQLTIQLRK